MGFNSVDPIAFGSVSHVTETLSHGLEVGTKRVVDGREYVLVYNDGGEQASPGLGMRTNGGAGSLYSCTVTTATGVGAGIGVVRNATLTTASYGWLVTKGVTPIEMGASSGTVATGKAAELGDDGLWFPVSDATGLRGPTQALALDTIVTGASGDAAVFMFG